MSSGSSQIQSKSFTDHTQISLLKLTWPIFIENILRVSLSSVDVFMLSFYSEKAVAAVGLTSQIVFFIQLLYLMVAIGSSILISQYLGARREKEAGQIALGSLTLGLVFSIVLSTGICISANRILLLYRLDPVVHKYAWQFLTIFAAGSVFMAIGMIQGTILRTHGHSREPMIVNIIANIINVSGNYLFIFGPLGIPVLGVTGVALSTVFSQAVACYIQWRWIKKFPDIKLPLREMFRVPFSVYKKILSVGVPTAGENLSYNIGQIIIMGIVSSMGTDAMAAFVYAVTILRFVFITSISIGNGTQIKVGYFVGAGKASDALKKVYGYFLSGFFISLILVVILNFIKIPVVGLFTHNHKILGLLSAVFLVALIHEPGRNFNVIIIPALKGAGDVRFPVVFGMIFMWGIGVVLAYVLGIKFALGLTGVWIALAADEWIRGLVMLLRWKSEKWKNKQLVPIAEINEAEAFPAV